jgi:hypothetical protein
MNKQIEKELEGKSLKQQVSILNKARVKHGLEKLTPLELAVFKLVYQAVKEHKTLWFYYESVNGEYWRKVEPYLIAIHDVGNGNFYFTGYQYPSEYAKKKNSNNNQGSYLFNKIDLDRFQILDETFDSVNVEWDNIYGILHNVIVIKRGTGLKRLS